ncbi:MAG: FHA domain-containing protein, partial [Chthoniobacterales bacterium]
MITAGSATVAHELAEEFITIGRSPENLIHLDDPSVSSRHAQ